jgi:hypothetical protein
VEGLFLKGRMMIRLFKILAITIMLGAVSACNAGNRPLDYRPVSGEIDHEARTRAFYECKAESDAILYGPGSSIAAAYSAAKYMGSCMRSKGYTR